VRVSKPAANAGVTPNLEWIRTKLYQAKCKDKAAFRFSSFLENPLVSRVKRRIATRMVRFWRSMNDVDMAHRCGSPLIRIGITSAISEGLYRSRVDSGFKDTSSSQLRAYSPKIHR
jgi:hypothetical protein